MLKDYVSWHAFWVTYTEFLVARPLFNVRQVVAYVHSLRPVAEVLPQQQVVQRTRANVVKQLKQSLALLSVFHRFLYNYWERSKSWWWHWGHQLQGISRKDTNNLNTFTQWWTCTSITKFTMKMYYVSKLAWEEQHYKINEQIIIFLYLFKLNQNSSFIRNENGNILFINLKMASKSNTNKNYDDLKKSMSAFNTDVEYSIYLQNHLSYQFVWGHYVFFFCFKKRS